MDSVGGPNSAAACVNQRLLGTQPRPLTYILFYSKVEWLPAKPKIFITWPFRAVTLLQGIRQPPSQGPGIVTGWSASTSP